MSLFPDTPLEMIRSLADADAVDGDIRWTQFVELYERPIRNFIQLCSADLPSSDVDDITQETFIRLVSVIRNRLFDPQKGKFRTLLSVIVQRLLIDHHRATNARPAGSTDVAELEELPATTPAAEALLEMKWRLARHQAAVGFVLERSAISDQSRQVYMMSEIDGLSDGEISQRTGLARNAIRRIRSRVKKMVSAIESPTDFRA